MVSSSMLGTSSSASLILALRCLAVTVAILGRGRVEPRHEHGEQSARNVGIAVQHRGDEILALRDAGLLQVAAIGAQDTDRRGTQPGRLGKAVVAVIVGVAVPDRQEHLLEQLAAVGEVDRGRRHFRVPCRARRRVRRPAADLEGALADHPEADVFEDRHAPRQRDRAAEMIDLQRCLLRRLVGVPVVVDGDRVFGAYRAAIRRGIDQRLVGSERAAVAFGKPRRDPAAPCPRRTSRRLRAARPPRCG